jgi:hypothetical protein
MTHPKDIWSASAGFSRILAMDTSLASFRLTVLERLLDLLWRQWSALGVAGSSPAAESAVVDPEALLLLTLTVARYDPRLFDEVIDWLEVNGSSLNAQRLQNLMKEFDFQAKAQVGAVAERLGKKSSAALKWRKLAAGDRSSNGEVLFRQKNGLLFPVPVEQDGTFARHGLLRAPVKTRRLSQVFPAHGVPTLLLRLRALIGISLRCEILCLLASVDEIHPARMARLLGYAARSVQNALVEMERSGLVQVRTRGREKVYSLVPGRLGEFLGVEEKPLPWVNSAALFRALEVLWLGIDDPRQQNRDSLLLSSELRRTARIMVPLLGDAGQGQPLRDDSLYKGERYVDVFMSDTLALLGRV